MSFTFSFRIRKKYFDAIVREEKTVEYRRDIPFWRKRIKKALEICGVETQKDHIVFPEPSGAQAVFFCGRELHKREILVISKTKTPDNFSDQGKRDVNTESCWAFSLGREIK